MNKITGANKLNEADVAKIEMLCNRGLTNPEISIVTGWSVPVVNKIRNGSYYELNKRANEKRQREREMEKKTTRNAPPLPLFPLILNRCPQKRLNGCALPLNTITPL